MKHLLETLAVTAFLLALATTGCLAEPYPYEADDPFADEERLGDQLLFDCSRDDVTFEEHLVNGSRFVDGDDREDVVIEEHLVNGSRFVDGDSRDDITIEEHLVNGSRFVDGDEGEGASDPCHDEWDSDVDEDWEDEDELDE